MSEPLTKKQFKGIKSRAVRDLGLNRRDSYRLIDEIERLQEVVEEYEDLIPLALRGSLETHVDGKCVICAHAMHGQEVDGV